jgi:hypothetical protein
MTDWTENVPLEKLLEPNHFRPQRTLVIICSELRRIQKKSHMILVFIQMFKLKEEIKLDNFFFIGATPPTGPGLPQLRGF